MFFCFHYVFSAMLKELFKSAPYELIKVSLAILFPNCWNVFQCCVRLYAFSAATRAAHLKIMSRTCQNYKKSSLQFYNYLMEVLLTFSCEAVSHCILIKSHTWVNQTLFRKEFQQDIGMLQEFPFSQLQKIHEGQENANVS